MRSLPRNACITAALLLLPVTLPSIAGQSLFADETMPVPETTPATAAKVVDEPTVADAKAIGGNWFVTSSSPPVYLYQDAERMVDLFSWHQRDSNRDGIANLRLSHDETHLIIDSQGYPNHPTAIFPNSGNPNSIAVQNFRFRFPLQPRRSDVITRLPMGPIGMALNGVVFFNPFEQGGMNAVAGYSEVWLDSCCGHPQQTGVYHYHKYPACVKSPFRDDGKQHSPVIGFAFDGFPVYGPWESTGVMAKDVTGTESLDVCNGHSDTQRGYHYHVTPGRFPYVLGGYRGLVERSNLRQRGALAEGAIEDNSSGESRQPKVITGVLPGSALRGQKHQLTLILDPAKATRAPLPDAAPDWVQIGPFEAASISRNGNEVQVTVSIPEDAPAGILLDCHIEFSTAGRRQVFKLNEAFRVTVEGDE
ncbi:MAG: YHYH protein [Planctomycetaceae bacterium]